MLNVKAKLFTLVYRILFNMLLDIFLNEPFAAFHLIHHMSVTPAAVQFTQQSIFIRGWVIFNSYSLCGLEIMLQTVVGLVIGKSILR